MYLFNRHTVRLGSSDPFNIVSYYIKWVTTSLTFSINIHYTTNIVDHVDEAVHYKHIIRLQRLHLKQEQYTVCPRISDRTNVTI